MMNVLELNFALLLSNKLIDLAEVFAPHNNLPALDVYRISGNLNLPKTSSLTLTSYMSIDEEQDEACPVYEKLLAM